MIRFGARVDRRRRTDYGVLSFTDVIVKSSNVGAIKVGLQGRRRAPGRCTCSRFGFGRPIVAGLSRREPGHRLEPGEAERQRAGVGVDGLPGRRDAAADGGGGERGRQRRRRCCEPRVVRAVDQGRRAHAGRRRRSCGARSAPDTAADADRRSWRRSSTDGTGKLAQVPGLHGRRQDRHRRQARQRPLLARRSTTCRSSASCRRATRRSRSIVVIDSPRVGGDTGGAVAAPIFKRIAEASAAPPRRRADDQSRRRRCWSRAAERDAGDAGTASAGAAASSPLAPADVTASVRARPARPERARRAARRWRALGLTRAHAGHRRRRRADARRRHRRSSAARPARSSSTRDAAAADLEPWSPAVTLGDVARDALRDLTADAPTLAGLARATPIVSAIVYDSRRVAPGSVFVALRGLEGRRRARSCRRRSRAAPRASSPKQPRPAAIARAVARRQRRAAGAGAARRRVLRPSEPARCRSSASPAPTARRRRRTCSRRSSTRRACRAGCSGTVAYRIGGEDREASRTTPEAPDVQQLLREMVDARLRLVRDGSVVARAGAAARRRHALRRRRLHQPDARSPRLPRRHGGRTSRPSAGCSRCCRADAPGVINLDDPRGAALVEVVRAGR